MKCDHDDFKREGDKCEICPENTTVSESPSVTGLWRTLDTVPRDGTPVDLWHKNGFRLTEVWWADDCWSCVMDDNSFTHWMPIPPAP